MFIVYVLFSNKVKNENKALSYHSTQHTMFIVYVLFSNKVKNENKALSYLRV